MRNVVLCVSFYLTFKYICGNGNTVLTAINF